MSAIENVNKIISDYFEEHLAHVDVSCGMEFGYYPDEDEITWGLYTNERQDKTFADFFENTLGCRKIHAFIYSIFHEFGHKVTLPQFSNEDWFYYRLRCDGMTDEEDADERDYMYYNLPIEEAASKWAVDYINNHYDEIVDWAAEKLCPALDELENDPAVNEATNLLLLQGQQ